MTKKERTLAILKILRDKGLNYEILSESGSIPNHIRIKGWGDIWPSTGTFHKDKVWHKRDFNKLVRALGAPEPEKKVTTADRVLELESTVLKLTERIEQMDEELDAVKSMLCI